MVLSLLLTGYFLTIVHNTLSNSLPSTVQYILWASVLNTFYRRCLCSILPFCYPKHVCRTLLNIGWGEINIILLFYSYSILPLCRSRDILSRLTDAPLDNGSFPSGTHQLIQVAGHTVRALRVSFVGSFFFIDLIRTRLDLNRIRLDLIRSRLDLIRRYGRYQGVYEPCICLQVSVGGCGCGLGIRDPMLFFTPGSGSGISFSGSRISDLLSRIQPRFLRPQEQFFGTKIRKFFSQLT